MGSTKVQAKAVNEIMTSDFEYVKPNTIMTQVAKIFDKASFHHLPVLDEHMKPLGVISRLDYHQLQHHFTRFGWQDPKSQNKYLFGTLLAQEVMTDPAITLNASASLQEALNIFLKNQVHSILIISDAKCVGILTPFDILNILDLEEV